MGATRIYIGGPRIVTTMTMNIYIIHITNNHIIHIIITEEITGKITVIWAMGNMMVGMTGGIETWEIFTRSGQRRGRGGC